LTVSIVDVAPRDGLQIEQRVLSPALRAELAGRLAAAGLRRIEAASFVNPERVPAMAGAEEVAELLGPSADVRYAGLVLNDRGYQRLARTPLTEVRVVVSCTESFSRANTAMSVAAAADFAERAVAAAHAQRRTASATLAVAFGCPFEGTVSPAAVTALAERMLAAGVDELLFADTIGVGMPGQVRQLLGAVAGCGVPVGVHLHDTRNTAIVNAYVAMQAGATVFDASVGGVGGCPFAPGATGNVATEDLVYLFHREGIETGIDLGALIDVAHWLQDILGHPVTGSVQKAGAPLLDTIVPA
jgi:isopropylmalate/homocitrate/citramalate synthase